MTEHKYSEAKLNRVIDSVFASHIKEATQLEMARGVLDAYGVDKLEQALRGLVAVCKDQTSLSDGTFEAALGAAEEALR